MIQRAKLRRRLEVDFLEERQMLSVSWTNPSGGDWDDPNNWSTKVLPGANDDVVINVAGAGWTGSKQFADRAAWDSYVKDFAARVAHPLSISVTAK